jgi:hypothetical protein
MFTGAQIGLLFIALALLFSGLSFRDYLWTGGNTTPARRAWLRIAMIFAIVGILLFVQQSTTIP